MKNTKSHDEDGVIKPDAQLSGNAYVMVTLRDTDDPYGRILLVWNPHRCNHGYTICVECADSWELDHHVHYDLTGGGRRLRKALDTPPAIADTAETDTGGTQPAEADTAEADSWQAQPAREVAVCQNQIGTPPPTALVLRGVLARRDPRRGRPA
ncbi:hypothetical protein [Nocardia sp. bgisy134]|uniref:hypothetical protein n=1 Tax=Nocardia sp. bgisy134 TaxID=3413789 RepID=UPI003D756EDD